MYLMVITARSAGSSVAGSTGVEATIENGARTPVRDASSIGAEPVFVMVICSSLN